MCGTVLDSRKIHRTRKRRQCFGCGRAIPKGTMATYTVVVDNRDLSANYMCLDCDEFQKTKAGRDAADDDGCLWPLAFRDAEAAYVNWPILEPV